MCVCVAGRVVRCVCVCAPALMYVCCRFRVWVRCRAVDLAQRLLAFYCGSLLERGLLSLAPPYIACLGAPLRKALTHELLALHSRALTGTRMHACMMRRTPVWMVVAHSRQACRPVHTCTRMQLGRVGTAHAHTCNDRCMALEQVHGGRAGCMQCALPG